MARLRLSVDSRDAERGFERASRAGRDYARGGARLASDATARVAGSLDQARRSIRVSEAALTGLSGAFEDVASRAGPLAPALRALGPAGAAATAGIGATVAGLAGIRAASDRARDIERMAREANAGAEEFQALAGALGEFGLQNEDVADALKEQSSRLDEFATTGVGPAAEAFGRLGISASEAARLTEDSGEALQRILSQIQELENEAAQTRILDEVFGDEAGRLLGRVEGDIGSLTQRARDLGLVIDASLVERGAEASRQFDILGRAIGTQLTAAAAQAGPALTNLLDSAVEALPGLIASFEGLAQTVGVIDTVSARSEMILLQGEIEQTEEQFEELRRGAAQISLTGDRSEGIARDLELMRGQLGALRRAADETASSTPVAGQALTALGDAADAAGDEIKALGEDASDGATGVLELIGRVGDLDEQLSAVRGGGRDALIEVEAAQEARDLIGGIADDELPALRAALDDAGASGGTLAERVAGLIEREESLGEQVSDASDGLSAQSEATTQLAEDVADLDERIRDATRTIEDDIDAAQRQAEQRRILARITREEGAEAARELESRLTILNEAEDRGIDLTTDLGQAWLEARRSALRAGEGLDDARGSIADAGSAAGGAGDDLDDLGERGENAATIIEGAFEDLGRSITDALERALFEGEGLLDSFAAIARRSIASVGTELLVDAGGSAVDAVTSAAQPGSGGLDFASLGRSAGNLIDPGNISADAVAQGAANFAPSVFSTGAVEAGSGQVAANTAAQTLGTAANFAPTVLTAANIGRTFASGDVETGVQQTAGAIGGFAFGGPTGSAIGATLLPAISDLTDALGPLEALVNPVGFVSGLLGGSDPRGIANVSVRGTQRGDVEAFDVNENNRKDVSQGQLEDVADAVTGTINATLDAVNARIAAGETFSVVNNLSDRERTGFTADFGEQTSVSGEPVDLVAIAREIISNQIVQNDVTGISDRERRLAENSDAEDLQGFLEDLQFGETFERLKDALSNGASSIEDTIRGNVLTNLGNVADQLRSFERETADRFGAGAPEVDQAREAGADFLRRLVGIRQAEAESVTQTTAEIQRLDVLLEEAAPLLDQYGVSLDAATEAIEAQQAEVLGLREAGLQLQAAGLSQTGGQLVQVGQSLEDLRTDAEATGLSAGDLADIIDGRFNAALSGVSQDQIPKLISIFEGLEGTIPGLDTVLAELQERFQGATDAGVDFQARAQFRASNQDIFGEQALNQRFSAIGSANSDLFRFLSDLPADLEAATAETESLAFQARDLAGNQQELNLAMQVFGENIEDTKSITAREGAQIRGEFESVFGPQGVQGRLQSLGIAGTELGDALASAEAEGIKPGTQAAADFGERLIDLADGDLDLATGALRVFGDQVVEVGRQARQTANTNIAEQEALGNDPLIESSARDLIASRVGSLPQTPAETTDRQDLSDAEFVDVFKDSAESFFDDIGSRDIREALISAIPEGEEFLDLPTGAISRSQIRDLPESSLDPISGSFRRGLDLPNFLEITPDALSGLEDSVANSVLQFIGNENLTRAFDTPGEQLDSIVTLPDNFEDLTTEAARGLLEVFGDELTPFFKNALPSASGELTDNSQSFIEKLEGFQNILANGNEITAGAIQDAFDIIRGFDNSIDTGPLNALVTAFGRVEFPEEPTAGVASGSSTSPSNTSPSNSTPSAPTGPSDDQLLARLQVRNPDLFPGEPTVGTRVQARGLDGTAVADVLQGGVRLDDRSAGELRDFINSSDEITSGFIQQQLPTEEGGFTPDGRAFIDAVERLQDEASPGRGVPADAIREAFKTINPINDVNFGSGPATDFVRQFDALGPDTTSQEFDALANADLSTLLSERDIEVPREPGGTVAFEDLDESQLRTIADAAVERFGLEGGSPLADLDLSGAQDLASQLVDVAANGDNAEEAIGVLTAALGDQADVAEETSLRLNDQAAVQQRASRTGIFGESATNQFNAAGLAESPFEDILRDAFDLAGSGELSQDIAGNIGSVIQSLAGSAEEAAPALDLLSTAQARSAQVTQEAAQAEQELEQDRQQSAQTRLGNPDLFGEQDPASTDRFTAIGSNNEDLFDFLNNLPNDLEAGATATANLAAQALSLADTERESALAKDVLRQNTEETAQAEREAAQAEEQAQRQLEQAQQSRAEFLRRDETARERADRLNGQIEGPALESQSATNDFVEGLNLSTEAGREASRMAQNLAPALDQLADEEARAQRQLEQARQSRTEFLRRDESPRERADRLNDQIGGPALESQSAINDFVEGLDLSTEAGREASRMAQNLAPALDQVAQSQQAFASALGDADARINRTIAEAGEGGLSVGQQVRFNGALPEQINGQSVGGVIAEISPDRRDIAAFEDVGDFIDDNRRAFESLENPVEAINAILSIASERFIDGASAAEELARAEQEAARRAGQAIDNFQRQANRRLLETSELRSRQIEQADIGLAQPLLDAIENASGRAGAEDGLQDALDAVENGVLQGNDLTESQISTLQGAVLGAFDDTVRELENNTTAVEGVSQQVRNLAQAREAESALRGNRPTFDPAFSTFLEGRLPFTPSALRDREAPNLSSLDNEQVVDQLDSEGLIVRFGNSTLARTDLDTFGGTEVGGNSQVFSDLSQSRRGEFQNAFEREFDRDSPFADEFETAIAKLRNIRRAGENRRIQEGGQIVNEALDALNAFTTSAPNDFFDDVEGTESSLRVAFNGAIQDIIGASSSENSDASGGAGGGAPRAADRARQAREEFLRRNETPQEAVDRINGRIGGPALESQSALDGFVKGLDLSTEAGREALQMAQNLAPALSQVADAGEQARQRRGEFLRRDETAEERANRLNDQIEGPALESQSAVNDFVRGLELSTEAGREAFEVAQDLAPALDQAAQAERERTAEIERQTEALERAGRGVADTLESFLIESEASPLTRPQRLSEAEDQFAATLAQAQNASGDDRIAATEDLSGDFTRLADAAEAVFQGGASQVSLIQGAISDLQSLPQVPTLEEETLSRLGEVAANTERTADRLFQELDTNDDGVISRQEIANSELSRIEGEADRGADEGKRAADRLFQELDTNDDGTLSPAEFSAGVSDITQELGGLSSVDNSVLGDIELNTRGSSAATAQIRSDDLAPLKETADEIEQLLAFILGTSTVLGVRGIKRNAFEIESNTKGTKNNTADAALRLSGVKGGTARTEKELRDIEDLLGVMDNRLKKLDEIALNTRFNPQIGEVLDTVGDIFVRMGKTGQEIDGIERALEVVILGTLREIRDNTSNITGAATGGFVRGAGGPTEDNQLRALSVGEAVIPAAQAGQYRSELEDLIAGGNPFETGLAVTPAPVPVPIAPAFPPGAGGGDDAAVARKLDAVVSRLDRLDRSVGGGAEATVEATADSGIGLRKEVRALRQDVARASRPAPVSERTRQ